MLAFCISRSDNLGSWWQGSICDVHAQVAQSRLVDA